MHGARIGPNAILQVVSALRSEGGPAAAESLFCRAGLSAYLDHPPESMVDEAEVAHLHRVLRDSLGPGPACRISRLAGESTAEYLLRHRIPRPVGLLLKALPAALAGRMLVAAISRHAWTFAGSGVFGATGVNPVRLQISGNPMCKGLSSAIPACDYYAATFEGLFRSLVHADATVFEVECEAVGAPACVFEVRW